MKCCKLIVVFDVSNISGIVDVFVNTPLGISDHCFVSCVLQDKQSVPECNIGSTVFLKHRTNWDNVRCAVRSFTWSTILKSADPLDAFDRAIGEVIGRLVPITVLRSRSGDKQWLDASCRRELMMLSRLLIMPGVKHAVQIIGVDLCLLVLRPRGSMVLQGSQIMNEPVILRSTPPVQISDGRH